MAALTADRGGLSGGRRRGGVFGLAVLLLTGATMALALAWVLVGEQLADAAKPISSGMLAAAVIALGALLVLLLVNDGIRGIARHTFTQCLRTKVAAVFIILLAAALGTLPFLVKGDGTLAGQVQTFLAYGTSITGLLLSLVTVFLAAGVISSDVRHRQIFIVSTKPLARWQYILGRWLGLVLVNAMLLAVAAVGMYAMAQYLRGGTPLNANDRRRLETEIFTARVKVRPVPIDVEGRVRQRLAKLRQDSRQYEQTLKAYMEKTDQDREAAVAMLKTELAKQALGPYQSASPGRGLVWRFEGIKVAGEETHGQGKVLKIPRPLTLRLEADEAVSARLIHRGPVRVNDIEGRVEKLKVNHFDVVFEVEALAKSAVRTLKPGDQVDLTVDPVIQIQYKAAAAGSVPDDLLHSSWIVTNPTTGATYYERRTDPVRQMTTLTPPARVVDKAGRTEVRYINRLNPQTLTGTNVTILQEDVAVLYRVGSFEANFTRAILLSLLQLMFLAGLGVFAASFASFPVACIVCFVALPFAMAQGFLKDAVRLPTGSDAWQASWHEQLGHVTVKLMAVLLPDFGFGGTSPGDNLVDGMYIPWTQLGAEAVATLAVRAIVFLAFACLIFHKRELARVQV